MTTGNTTASKAMGTVLKKGLVVVGGLTKIAPPERSTDSKDVTTLDVTDGYKRFLPGLKDGGEVTLTGFFAFADAGQLELETALDAGTTDAYSIVFPATIGATFTFSAFILKFKVDAADVDNPLGFEVTLKISGKPVLAASGV